MQAPSGLKADDAIPKAVLHPGSRSLFGYWNRLRGDRRAPGRAEIDLRMISAMLPWIGIIERRAGARSHSWRLTGTGIARLWGRGLTGTNVAADWPDVYRRALARALDGVCNQSQPFVARLKAISANGDALGVEFLAVPVEAGEGSFQALCSVSPFREPQWLGRVPLVGVELSALNALWLGPLPNEMRSQHRHAPAAPRFRLIKGGRSE